MPMTAFGGEGATLHPKDIRYPPPILLAFILRFGGETLNFFVSDRRFFAFIYVCVLAIYPPVGFLALFLLATTLAFFEPCERDFGRIFFCVVIGGASIGLERTFDSEHLA